MQLRIDSLAAGGEAVARAPDGRVIFVDGGVPGDLVEVELSETKARFARGRVVRLVEAGAARVAPPCPVADRCGGCPWQVVADDAQRTAKRDIVTRALSRLPVRIEPLVAAPAMLGYRVRASLHANRGEIGFLARRSHELVSHAHCLALVPALDDALAYARNYEDGALPRALGQEGTLRGTVVESGAVQLAFAAGRGADTTKLASLAAAFVGHTGIVGVLDGRSTFGDALLDAGVAGAPHWVSAEGFRQANHAQNDRLRALVKDALLPIGEDVFELYAGDGNFTRDFVDAKRVVAVEEDAAAVARLRKSLPSVTAVRARAEDEAARRARQGECFTRVLINPPRTGAKEAMPHLVALAPTRIVYVSCDPATLARDAAVLVQGGYTLATATPIDMMPHTDHVEVVLLAVR